MSLPDQTVDGIRWTSGARLLSQLANLVLTLVLARLLTPAEFGKLAMVTVVTGFVSLFGELGFGAALIQRKDLKEEHYSSVFWLNVGTGVILGGGVALSAPILAGFYREDDVLWLARAVAFGFVLAPLSMVQNAILNRSMAFRRLAAVESVTTLTTGGVALALALGGFGVWSLVARLLLASVVSATVLWSMSPWRPSWKVDVRALRELLGFSSNLVGFAAINYWARQVDDLLIGRVMGAAALGNYSRAYSIMMLPIQEVSGVLTRVMFPAMSRVQGDKPLVRSMYLQTISCIALITFPLMLTLLVTAERVVVVFYGAQWLDMVPVLEVFCIVGMVQSIGTTVGWIYQSQGRTDWMFRWGLVASPVLIAGIVWGVFQGTPLHVAYGYAAAMALSVYPLFAVPGHLIGMRPAQVLGAVGPAGLCACLGAGAAWLVGEWVYAWGSLWLCLALQVVGAIAVYAGVVAAFRLQAWSEFRRLILKR